MRAPDYGEQRKMWDADLPRAPLPQSVERIGDGAPDWETPASLFAALNDEFCFVCDCAARADNARVPQFISPERNALMVDWPRGACWLNPPYGKGLGAWIRKSVKEARLGSTVVCLIPVRSGTAWWQDEIGRHATEVRLMRGRVYFRQSNQCAPFSSCVIVFTPQGGPPKLSHVDLPRGPT